jgi:hypothetical protein
MKELMGASVSPNYYTMVWLMDYANFIKVEWRHIWQCGYGLLCGVMEKVNV